MEWRPVVDYEDRYEVSDEGDVRGLKRGAILRPFSLPSGHLCVNLSKSGNRRRVHRLVLEAFVGPCPAGLEARHFPDPDLTNNRLENLSWSTRRDNNAASTQTQKESLK